MYVTFGFQPIFSRLVSDPKHNERSKRIVLVYNVRGDPPTSDVWTNQRPVPRLQYRTCPELQPSLTSHPFLSDENTIVNNNP